MTAAKSGGKSRGYLSTSDDGTNEGTKLEVYTFLHNPSQRTGAVTLMIDYETRGAVPSGAHCGNGALAKIEALVVRLRPGGRVDRERVKLNAVACGQAIPDGVRYNTDTMSDLLARG